MLTFLEEILSKLKQNKEELSSSIFILPSKRACGFLVNYIKNSTTQTKFAPKIISIEEFVEELSGLKIIDSTELLFKSYEVYLNTSKEQEKDSFDVYATWATTLLNDFNEIDRFLIPPKPFFNYLGSIQDMNHWYLKDKKTALIENYLIFWNSLDDFYQTLKNTLQKEGVGYQGLVYREASYNIEHYLKNNKKTTHFFIGFNALNTAEQTIFQEVLESGNSEIYWDVDAYFYNDKKHSASLFLRNYTSTWNYFKKQPPIIISDNYRKDKTINIVEVQKNIGQVKYISEQLSNLSETELSNTAIVLADEQLLHPLLQSLPNNIKNVNITMGVALKSFPVVVFFELLLSLHVITTNKYYYKQLLAILNHPISTKLFSDTRKYIDYIATENLTHVSYSDLSKIADKEELNTLNLVFGDWKDDSSAALNSCKNIVLKLKGNAPSTAIEKVVIYQLYKAFEKVSNLNNKFEYLKSIKTVQNLFLEFIATATLDFKGDAYNGLQIMGVLETRVLDFKNLIIASVNEGVFPSGKSNNSFITYDLKKEFNLPTFTEKDAIYTYHFYRLLHRASNVTLLYNNFSGGLDTGEKSRFISQIAHENIKKHTINKMVVHPKIPFVPSKLNSVEKTPEVIARLKEIANKGFSPSALTSYIRNPMDFYYKRILGIKEQEEVEETVAANTLGTIVHDTLEEFYQPFKGSYLTIEILKKMKLSIVEEINNQFIKTFKGGDYSKGKNLIIFEVAKRFVENFINFEIDEIKKGNKIKILHIESNLSVQLSIPELGFPVKIHGKVDRVDQYNGTLRIIDYKSGKVEQSHLNIIDWNKVTEDYKYSKIIQVLAYALMINEESPFKEAEAGIISFKNLRKGFLKFTKKEGLRKPGNSIITEEVFFEYLIQLKKLIAEICNPEIPFKEKEV